MTTQQQIDPYEQKMAALSRAIDIAFYPLSKMNQREIDELARRVHEDVEEEEPERWDGLE